MERRDFLKISAVGSAAAALEGCGNPDHQLIRFIPEEDLIPGIATWKPSICTQCPAGCGLLVRVIQGEAEVIRHGQLGLIKMGLAKKLEGNPNHPINQGKLCPRGQTGLQVTYHPDRVRTPLQRTGPRGSGQFKEISWDDAIKQLVSQISPLQGAKKASDSHLVFVSGPLRGQRGRIVDTFARSFGIAPIFSRFFEDAVSSSANMSAVTPDLANSNYVISFGADFLGTWNSPVAQSIGYGTMRKGRSGQRGKFVHVEPRLSQTAANADEWVWCSPGTEGLFALSLAHVIIRDKLRPAGSAAIEGWSQGLPDCAPEKTAGPTGVPAAKATRIAHELASTSPAVALIGGGATAQSNGFFNALAVNALNGLLGDAGKPGGLLSSPELDAIGPDWKTIHPTPGWTVRNFTSSASPIALEEVKALLLYDANPVFATPLASGIRDAIGKIPFVASLGSFIDETSILADLILPDHSPLESWLDDVPPSGSTKMVASLAAPAMNPLHNTRSMPDVLLDVAQQLGGDLAKALPWKTYDEALKASFTEIYKTQASKDAKDADEFWQKVQDQGGWWSAEEKPLPVTAPKLSGAPAKYAPPQFDGDPGQYPFHLLPYASQMWYDGSLANLPWMQEAPDPVSSAMWGTWVEINTQTAAKLGIVQGDQIEVASQHGTLQAPAFVTPGIAPDCVAMPVGQGHTNFTRYASNRGANPISILAPLTDSETGSLAWAATRVKITRLGEGKLVLFGGGLTEMPPDLKHR
ncbi:MAG TPA: molybdopterin-dependent oxidoreductase [Candidatus Acidoferrales bacterium]|jgi:anaerobic selenocysteine-containing dehydrogenase|nr:molybdopterin-dependent oxidoreductase [Candidatus Acidoferrales bacterium]